MIGSGAMYASVPHVHPFPATVPPGCGIADLVRDIWGGEGILRYGVMEQTHSWPTWFYPLPLS